MKNYIQILKRTALFSGISEDDIIAMTNCLGAKLKDYKKGEYIFRQGEYLDHFFVLLSGCVHIQSIDYWGNRSIISEVKPSELFGEAYAVHGSCAALIDAVATNDCTIALLNVKKLIAVCPRACSFHSAVIQNLLVALAHKNRSLMQKLTHISKRTTREKLISYLSNQAKLNGCNSFFIPFNRQQLADFLSVDRSAMSNELCKMRDEGLLTFEKNSFTLL